MTKAKEEAERHNAQQREETEQLFSDAFSTAWGARTQKGTYTKSNRSFGIAIPLSKLKINSRGITKVKEHLAKMHPDAANDEMIGRLGQIASGKLKATSQDLNFYAHELRESQLMSGSGGMGYDEAHVQALKDYGI